MPLYYFLFTKKKVHPSFSQLLILDNGNIF